MARRSKPVKRDRRGKWRDRRGRYTREPDLQDIGDNLAKILGREWEASEQTLEKGTLEFPQPKVIGSVVIENTRPSDRWDLSVEQMREAMTQWSDQRMTQWVTSRYRKVFWVVAIYDDEHDKIDYRSISAADDGNISLAQAMIFLDKWPSRYAKTLGAIELRALDETPRKVRGISGPKNKDRSVSRLSLIHI